MHHVVPTQADVGSNLLRNRLASPIALCQTLDLRAPIEADLTQHCVSTKFVEENCLVSEHRRDSIASLRPNAEVFALFH